MSRPPQPPPPAVREPDKLTAAQRRAVSNADLGWVGWDVKGRPVIAGLYHGGILQRRGNPHRNSEKLQWAILRTGEPVAAATPIRYFEGCNDNG